MSALRTGEPRLRRLIDANAAWWQLPGLTYRGQAFLPAEWFEGLLWHESAHGNPSARRYEPHQDRPGRKDQAQDGDRPGIDDGPREDDASYGLGQVMGYTFEALVDLQPRNATMNYEVLYHPPIGIAFAGLTLSLELAAVYRERPHESEDERVIRALARYNGGPTGDDIDEASQDIRCRGYVNLVTQAAAIVRADRQRNGWRVA